MPDISPFCSGAEGLSSSSETLSRGWRDGRGRTVERTRGDDKTAKR